MPVEGGEEQFVLDQHRGGYWRYWAVTSQGIYFATAEVSSRPVVEFFSFATGEISQVATLEKPIVDNIWGFSVSPDERWMLFTQQDQGGSDIMLMEDFR